MASIEDLPYGGDVQAAQAAGDRTAIRRIFYARAIAAGEPVPEVLDLENPAIADEYGDMRDEDVATVLEDLEEERRRRIRQLVCLLFIMPTILFLLLVTSQAQEQAQPHYSSSSSSQHQQYRWWVDPDKQAKHGSYSDDGYNNNDSYRHYPPTREDDEVDDPYAVFYYLGFAFLILGVAQGNGTVFHIGGAMMLLTSSVNSFQKDHAIGVAAFFGVTGLLSLWVALRLGCVGPVQQRQEQEESVERAIGGLKTIIYRRGRQHLAKSASIRSSNVSHDEDGDAEEGEWVGSSSSGSGGILERAKRGVQKQYKRVASLIVGEDPESEDEDEDEDEECPICLEVFQDGDELAASGCGHYFHPKCVKEWVQVDSQEHQSQIRCPVCRYDVLDGVGAPTPAQIKHMRPIAAHATNSDTVEIDLEIGHAHTSDLNQRPVTIWGRIRTVMPSFGRAQGTTQPALEQSVVTDLEPPTGTILL